MAKQKITKSEDELRKIRHMLEQLKNLGFVADYDVSKEKINHLLFTSVGHRLHDDLMKIIDATPTRDIFDSEFFFFLEIITMPQKSESPPRHEQN